MSHRAPCRNGEGCWTGSLADIYGSRLNKVWQKKLLGCAQAYTDVFFLLTHAAHEVLSELDCASKRNTSVLYKLYIGCCIKLASLTGKIHFCEGIFFVVGLIKNSRVELRQYYCEFN